MTLLPLLLVQWKVSHWGDASLQVHTLVLLFEEQESKQPILNDSCGEVIIILS